MGRGACADRRVNRPRRKKRTTFPELRTLSRIASALRYEPEELSKDDLRRCAETITKAVQWISEAQPQRRGPKADAANWSAVLMVKHLLSHKHVDNEEDAIAAVTGQRKGGAYYERVRRYLHNWRAGKWPPGGASMRMSDVEVVLRRLTRTHRIK